MDIKLDNLKIIENKGHFTIVRDNQFFRLGLDEGKILKELYTGKTVSEISLQYKVTEVEIKDFIAKLVEIGILGKKQKNQRSFLFYKIKLFNPDRLFTWINQHFFEKKDLNNKILFLGGLVVLFGFITLLFNYEKIVHNTIKQLSIQDILILYMCTIITVLCHEIGHGLVCKHYGGKVLEIGFMLIFGSPALYCDVSAIRTFNSRRKIIMTLLAGVLVQGLITAGFVFISIFVYKSNHLINTFIVWNTLMIFSNLLPITKLDGYWIISTLVNIPNLYEKSLKVALGKSKNVLFDEYEEKNKQLLKIYGFLNILTIFCIAISFIIGIYQFKIVSANILLNIFQISQVILGLITITCFIRMLVNLKIKG